MATKVVVPAAMREARQAYVAAGVSPREGVDALARLLASGLHAAVVSPFDIEDTLEQRRRSARARKATPVSADEAVSDAPEKAPFVGDGIEAQLTAVWADLLGVESIGLDENFFELGGHSLLATRVLARVFDAFGVQIPLRTLFEAPTVRQLAAIIGSRVEPATVAADGDREEIEL
jgi:acyl carrier protein